MKIVIEIIDDNTDELVDKIKEGVIMAIRPELQAYVEQVNAATDKIAARIQELINASTGLSQEEKDLLANEVADLEKLGSTEVLPTEPTA